MYREHLLEVFAANQGAQKHPVGVPYP